MQATEFPLLYHAHQGQFREDLPFWQRRAAEARSPLLELGCGTGRVALPLAAAGHVVLALDRDAAMLQFLRRQIPPDLRSSLWLIQADMAAFSLHRMLDLILIPCNTLSALEEAAFWGTLRCVQRHLRPGGRFIASMPNPAVMGALPPHGPLEVEDHFAHPRTGWPVQVLTAWERDARRLHVRWYYDHLAPDGRVERLSVQVSHRLADLEFYQQALQQVGLQLSRLWGDFEEKPYERTSPYLILEATRL